MAFIVSQAYPDYTNFVVAKDGGSFEATPAFVLPSGDVCVKIDLDTIGGGQHQFRFKAQNPMGESGITVFNFLNGAPEDPVLTIIE